MTDIFTMVYALISFLFLFHTLKDLHAVIILGLFQTVLKCLLNPTKDESSSF